MKQTLSPSAVEDLQFIPGRQVIYWDTDIIGFGVLCSAKTRTKTYVVQRELAGGNGKRVTRRVTIERTNLISFEEAQAQAKIELATMRSVVAECRLRDRAILEAVYEMGLIQPGDKLW